MSAKTILDKPARAVGLIIFIFKFTAVIVVSGSGATAPVKSAVAGW